MEGRLRLLAKEGMLATAWDSMLAAAAHLATRKKRGGDAPAGTPGKVMPKWTPSKLARPAAMSSMRRAATPSMPRIIWFGMLASIVQSAAILSSMSHSSFVGTASLAVAARQGTLARKATNATGSRRLHAAPTVSPSPKSACIACDTTAEKSALSSHVAPRARQKVFHMSWAPF